MATITINLADDLDAELEEHCAQLGKPKTDLVLELILQRIQRERGRKRMEDPAVIAETQRLMAAGLLDVDPHEYDDMLKEMTRP